METDFVLCEVHPEAWETVDKLNIVLSEVWNDAFYEMGTETKIFHLLQGMYGKHDGLLFNP